MAGTKISALPPASTLAGTELVPVVQAGSNKKATISQLLAGVNLDGYATTAAPTFTGGVTIPTPSAGSDGTIAASTAWVRTYVAGLAYTSNTGTVTSVSLTLPALFSVSGSPVTTAGTLTATLATQAANLVLAGPTTGAAAAPAFRALVAGDLPATAVTAGSYTYSSLTVDATGRITAASSGTAPLSVGTTSGTVAAGDDSRITGALSTTTAATTYQPLTANLSSLGAQAPSYYLGRANHTGTQAASTVTGLKDQIGIACSDETSNLTASTSAAKVTLRMPYAMTLTQVRLNVGTAPTDSPLIVNIKQGTTTIFSTRPQIDINAKTSVGSGTAAVFATTALTDDAEITIFVDQIGSTIAGSGLKVWLIGTRA